MITSAVLWAIGVVQAANLIVCDTPSGPFLTECHLGPIEPIAGPDYDADYTMRYIYGCEGSAIDVTYSNASEQVLLRRSPLPVEVSVRGTQAPTIALRDAELARRAYVVAGCFLNILEVRVAPSEATLRLWHSEGQHLAELLAATRTNYVLAKHIESIVHWDDAQLAALRPALTANLAAYLASQDRRIEECLDERGRIKAAKGLPPEWWAALAAYPEMADFVVLLEYIDGIIDRRPTLEAEQVVGASAGRLRRVLTEHFSELLSERIAAAQGLLRRFADIQHDADASLVRATEVAEQELEGLEKGAP